MNADRLSRLIVCLRIKHGTGKGEKAKRQPSQGRKNRRKSAHAFLYL
jgi:hypothetical protein